MGFFPSEQEIRSKNDLEIDAGNIPIVQRYNQSSSRIIITVSQFFYFLSLTFLFIIIMLITVLTYTTQKKQKENEIKLISFKSGLL